MRTIVELKFLLVIGIFFANVCYSQESFERQYEFIYNSEAHSVVELRDGSFMIGGYVSEDSIGAFGHPTLFRVDKSGNLLWARPFADKLALTPQTLILANNGNVVGMGCGLVEGAGYRACIMESDSNGALQWIKYFGDVYPALTLDESFVINNTNDSGYIATFFTPSVEYDSINHRGGTYILKLSSSGNVEWSHVISIDDTTEGVHPNHVQQLKDGSYLIGGRINNNENLKGAVLLKLAANGTPLWQRIFFNDPLTYNMSTKVLDDESVIFCGRPQNTYDLSVLKVSSEGEPIWTKQMKMDGRLLSTTVTQTLDKSICLSGFISFYPNGSIKTSIDSMFLMKLSPTGELISLVGMNVPDVYSHGHQIIATADTGFICVGSCSTTVKGAYGDLRKRVLAVKTTLKSEYCNFQNYPIESNIAPYAKLDLQIWDSTGISGYTFNPPTKTEYSFIQKDLCQNSSISSLINKGSIYCHISPNPILWASILTIHFTIHESTSPVTITLHDILGREVLHREMGVQAEGEHEESLDVSGLPIGSYIVKISTNGEVFTSRVSVVR